MSYLASKSTIVLNLFLFPGIVLALAIAAWLKSLWPIVVLMTLMVLELFRVVYLSPMIPIADNQVTENRRLGNIFLFLFLAVAGVILWFTF